MKAVEIKYIHKQGIPFEYYNNRSYLSITVLPELTGLPLSDLILGYIQGLRPSTLRIIDNDIDGFMTCDGRLYRVTVFLEKGLIKEIEQEVEVGLPDGIKNGHELATKRKKYGNE